MPHCHGTIEVAKILKRLHPHTPVSFGGLSSTIFHEDLIAYDCVDYVFRGDSTEEPMRMLLSRIRDAQRNHVPVGDLSDIPNLTWKDAEGGVHINPLSWVPDDMNAISMDYCYPMKGVLRHHDMTSYLPMKGWLSYPVTASLSCRGCARNCATCGGSAYAFKNHFGRRRVAWRDPQLMIRDIQHVQEHIWGPIFVLNDFLQAGEDYTHDFICGLKGKVKNPIGFEFFGPPPGGDDFYQMLDDNLENWSVEISAESHDDDVRKAFGKGHYKMTELEETIKDALSHPNCERFDLYFMTGIPKQTAASVRETGAYVQHLYELVNYDPRLVVLTSPMAPFLDVGSIAFDNPEKYGYKLRARTFEEHRERMILPSWKHIMNYESQYMSVDEMVEATYDAALDINRIKGEHGILDEGMARATDQRIREAREQMRRLDDVLYNGTGRIDARLGALKEEFERLSENTVAEKSELNWAFKVKPAHVKNLAKLWLTNEPANFAAKFAGKWRSAGSDFAYPDQEKRRLLPRLESRRYAELHVQRHGGRRHARRPPARGRSGRAGSGLRQRGGAGLFAKKYERGVRCRERPAGSRARRHERARRRSRYPRRSGAHGRARSAAGTDDGRRARTRGARRCAARPGHRGAPHAARCGRPQGGRRRPGRPRCSQAGKAAR